MHLQFLVCGNSKKSDQNSARMAQQLGSYIAVNRHILITGACWGLPNNAVTGANKANGITIGLSPATNRVEHIQKYNLPTAFSTLIYTGFGFKGRNVVTVRSADIVVFLPGGIGTLNEFTIALDEDKLIGILGDELVLKQIPEILKICGKNTNKIIYEENPTILVEKLLRKYRESINI
jgi:hypothetical protein